MMEFQDAMVIYPTVIAEQSLFVLQELVSVLLKLWLGTWH